MSNVELVLTAQNEFITDIVKRSILLTCSIFNILGYDHNPAIFNSPIAGFSHWRRGLVEPKLLVELG
jgi:hypothetical protein